MNQDALESLLDPAARLRGRRRVARRALLVACLGLALVAAWILYRRTHIRPFAHFRPEGGISALWLADRGRLLVTLGGRGPIQVWTLDDRVPALLRTISYDHKHEEIADPRTPDGEIVLLHTKGDEDGVRAVSLRTGETVGEPSLPPHYMVRPSPSGKLLGLVDKGRLEVRSLVSGEALHVVPLPSPPGATTFVNWPREDVLVLSVAERLPDGDDRTSRWYLTLEDLVWHGPVAHYAWLENMATASEVTFVRGSTGGPWDGRIGFLDLDGTRERGLALRSFHELHPLQLRSTGAFVLAMPEPDGIDVYSLTTGFFSTTLAASGPVSLGVFDVTEAGDRAASLLDDGAVEVWDLVPRD